MQAAKLQKLPLSLYPLFFFAPLRLCVKYFLFFFTYVCSVNPVSAAIASSRLYLARRSDCVIEPIADVAAGAPVYRSFVFRDYIDARSADNYADAGADDSQISDFAM